jgi:hypothetical protein
LKAQLRHAGRSSVPVLPMVAVKKNPELVAASPLAHI